MFIGGSGQEGAGAAAIAAAIGHGLDSSVATPCKHPTGMPKRALSTLNVAEREYMGRRRLESVRQRTDAGASTA
jgi:hypothetical protein